MMFYPISIEAGDDTHAYGVTVPDLPGCFSAGDTLDEAIANAKDAITGHTELLILYLTRVSPSALKSAARIISER